MHCHLKSVLLDYGPVFGFWLFSYERYNGILEHQPTSNRCIETQLMRRFLQDNLSHAFKPPSEYQSELGSLCSLQQKVTGSLLLIETGSHLTQTWSLEFPTYHTLYKLSFDEQQAVMEVLLNVQLLDSFEVNVLSRRYKYVLINGMKVASSTSKHSVVVMAHKNSHVANRESVAIPPNTLQPCKVNYFLKVTYSIDGCNFSSEFANVSWYKLHPQRFLLGKPVQLWCPDIFEDHSFLSLKHSHLYRCVYSPFNLTETGENLLAVTPCVS